MFEKLKSLFKSSDKPKKKSAQQANKAKTSGNNAKPKVQPTRIGELGEHKINIQLNQLPKECKYVSDLMVTNSKSLTGYSQIDHAVITSQGLFVIETKNYTGEIKGTRVNDSQRFHGAHDFQS